MDPARKPRPEFEPDIRPRFGVIQGGGETTDDRPAKGSLYDVNSSENPNGVQADDTSSDIQALREQEQEGTPRANWQDNTTEQPADVKTKGKVTWTGVLKKGGPLLGAGGIIGAIIFLLGGFLPTMLIPSLSQNAVIHNDVKGTLLERRLIAAIQQKMADKTGPCVTKSSLCLKNKMPKQMLASMAKAGIVPIGADGNPLSDDALSGKGYVDENPTKYQYGTEADGKTPRYVSHDQFLDEYKNNNKFRSTFKKAYNMRFLAYDGKGFSKLSALGLKKDGGASTDKEVTKDNITKKITTPTIDAGGDAESTKLKFRERVKLLFSRAKDNTKKTGGDPVILVGTGTCMLVNTPSFIANTYRSIQFAQVAVVVWSTILSPGDAIMAGAATGTAVSALGLALTNKYKKADGTFGKAAVDSPILQSAIGGNKNKVAFSKYVPGYSLFSNGIVKAFGGVAKETKQACQVINSPGAAAVSAGTTAAIGAASAGIGVAVLKGLQAAAAIMIGAGAVDAGFQALDKAGFFKLIGDTAFNLLGGAIPNIYDGVQGEDLGDALGIGIFALFSVSALGSGAAVLKKSQVGRFTAVMNDVDNQYKQEAIATLSPFDTSSNYTFLGNIVSKLATTTSISSNPITTSLSTIGSILKLPFTNYSSVVSAADQDIDAKCDYGGLVDIDADQDICINPAGYPMPGIPAEYIDLSRDTVQQQVANSIDDVTGEIRATSSLQETADKLAGKNNDITYMMNDCSQGDLDSIAGCTIDSDGSAASLKRAAQSLYVLDQEVESILNGTNEEEASGGSSTASGSYVLPTDQGYGYPDAEQDWGPRSLGFHRGVDIQGFSGGTIGKPVYAVTDGTVTRADMGNTACFVGTSDYSKAGNNVVEITHADGTYSGYWHMSASSVTVKVGDKVTAGQQIGTINECGLVTGPHLHFTISLGAATDPAITSIEQFGEFINPVDYMKLHGIDLMKGVYTDGR